MKSAPPSRLRRWPERLRMRTWRVAAGRNNSGSAHVVLWLAGLVRRETYQMRVGRFDCTLVRVRCESFQLSFGCGRSACADDRVQITGVRYDCVAGPCRFQPAGSTARASGFDANSANSAAYLPHPQRSSIKC